MQNVTAYPSRTIKSLWLPSGGGPIRSRKNRRSRFGAASWRTPSIIENAGSKGALAARTTGARRDPTFLALQIRRDRLVIARRVTTNFGVDSLKDFAPIGWTAVPPFSLRHLGIDPGLQRRRIHRTRKSQPDEILIGDSGIGPTPYLAPVSSAPDQPRLHLLIGITETPSPGWSRRLKASPRGGEYRSREARARP